MIKRIYFDNAASTMIAPEIVATMNEVIKNHYGNPSSIHHYGRQAKVIIENARKSTAHFLNVSPSEIVFTSGGTESNNMAIAGSIFDLNVKHIITSPIEHHSVLHAIDNFSKKGLVKVSLVKINKRGIINLNHLKELLSGNELKLVSLMYANNEIANLLPVKQVSKLCHENNAVFHCDMVQAMGHYRIDMQKLDIDFASCSAHKFHGPKGVGLLYINNQRVSINSLISGGAQEMNLRGGTENVYGIAGMHKAFELAYKNLSADKKHVQNIKLYMIQKIEENFPNIEFLGQCKNKSLYTIINILIPTEQSFEMLLFNLDIDGLIVSSGSACMAGIAETSHVIKALNIDNNRASIRFSFSRYSTFEEVDMAIKILKNYLK